MATAVKGNAATDCPRHWGNSMQVIIAIHCNENPIYVFLVWELRGLSHSFHIHVSVSDLYIPRIGPHIFLQKNRNIDCGEYIDRSQTHECGNWDFGCAIPVRGIQYLFTIFGIGSLQYRFHVGYGYPAALEKTIGTPPTKLVSTSSASLKFFLFTVVGQGHPQLSGDDENTSGRQAKHLHPY
jgi:hypothetical protein